MALRKSTKFEQLWQPIFHKLYNFYKIRNLTNTF